jgi:hypothetical protein
LWPIEITIRNFTVGWVKQRETQHPQHPTHPHRNIFMSKILKSIVGLAIITSTIGLAATPAKAESKAAQCKRFDQAMTIFGQQLDSIRYDENQSSTANYDRLLSTSKKELKQLQRKQFSDSKIRGFQQRALNTFVNVHNNISNAADAADRNDRAGYERIYAQLKPTIQPIRQLRKEFDKYCG